MCSNDNNDTHYVPNFILIKCVLNDNNATYYVPNFILIKCVLNDNNAIHYVPNFSNRINILEKVHCLSINFMSREVLKLPIYPDKVI